MPGFSIMSTWHDNLQTLRQGFLSIYLYMQNVSHLLLFTFWKEVIIIYIFTPLILTLGQTVTRNVFTKSFLYLSHWNQIVVTTLSSAEQAIKSDLNIDYNNLQKAIFYNAWTAILEKLEVILWKDKFLQ